MANGAALDAQGALADACPATRPGGPDDAVAGVVPSFVAEPASVAEAAALLRAAAEHDLAVVPRGAGTRLGWAPPPRRCDLVVGTGRLDQVIEHAAGDLVVTVQAGLPLARLQEALGRKGQRLALDPPAVGAAVGPSVEPTARSTVGGTLATAAAGPLRLLYGTARDLIIGITVVRADGVVARSGGKVVKNVAGYDLGKLFTGSLGTLGLIVEASFRLHPVPAAAAYVSTTAEDPGHAWELVRRVLHSAVVPSAVEVDRPADGPLSVAVLVEGVPEGVAARAETVRGLLGGGQTSDSPPGWWGRHPDGETLIEITARPSALPEVIGSAGSGVALRGSAGNGAWLAGLPAGTSPEHVAAFLEALRTPDRDAAPEAGSRRGSMSAVVLTLPGSVTGSGTERVDRWGRPAAPELMRRVKEQFDPQYRLSPGRFVGGI